MTGGEIFVQDTVDRLESRLNDQLVAAHRPEAGDLLELHALLQRHVRYTESETAATLLEAWEAVVGSF